MPCPEKKHTMQTLLDHNSVFFFASERCHGAFQKFCQRFSLTTSSVHDIFEIIDDETGEVLHQEVELTGILKYLELNPGNSFDFYLVDEQNQIFTFSYLGDGYQVMSLPYTLTGQVTLQQILDEFKAISGWETGEDSPPPANMDEIRAMTEASNSPFLRYRSGEFILPNT